MVINCQSISAKKASFASLVEQYKPAGTESWPSPTTPNYENFLHDYNISRKDKADGYGGVFIASRNHLAQLSKVCVKSILNIHLPNYALLI